MMSRPNISKPNLYGESLKPETVFRVHKHERDYLTVANATVQDERLSWEARGLLVYLLSLPTNWDIRVSHLQKQGGAGRDALRRILRELQEYGYASGVGRESQERCERGRFGPTEIAVYETPVLNPFYSENKAPSPENPSTVAQPPAVSPSPDLPSPENPPTYKEQNPQKTQRQQNTHKQSGLRAIGAPAQAANAGVGVVASKSRFSYELRKAYADAKGLGGGWLRNSQDGRYDDDEQFTEWRNSHTPEAIEQSLSTPSPRFKPYKAALMHIASVVSFGGAGSEPGPEIERLFESGQIDEATRDLLLARDWAAGAGGRAA